MANTLEFVVDTITADRLTGTLLDNTVYTDPLRANVAVFVSGKKITAGSAVESTLTVTGNNANPQTDTSWNFNIPKDGWFRFPIVSIPDFDTGETYDIYDAVFQTSTSKVYRSKQNGNTEDTLTNTTWWEEITDPSSLASNVGEANESLNIDSLIYEPGVFPNNEYGFANVISEASEEYLTSLHIPDDDLDNYSLLGVLIDGEVVKADRSEMNQAERVARKLESILQSINN